MEPPQDTGRATCWSPVTVTQIIEVRMKSENIEESHPPKEMPGEHDSGRPSSPTLNHGRTRPEAEEFALKNRRTNDWYRHDGQNVEAQPPPPSRLMKTAEDISNKYKGDSGEWYHDENGASQTDGKFVPTRVCKGEAKKNSDKIKGGEELWFSHEDNLDYVIPQAKSRLTGAGALETKDKATGQAKEWYRHDHSPNDPNDPNAPKPSKKRTPNKMRPAGTPEWYKYEHDPSETNGDSPRQGEEYLERNRFGSAEEWYVHHNTPAPGVGQSPRVTSPEGEANAHRLKGESADWFHHDGNYHDPAPQPRCRSARGRDMIEKSRGQEMQRIFTREDNVDYHSSRPNHITPEAREFAKRNVNGVMQNVLNQSQNQDYQSPKQGRRVRPEGRDFADRQRGIMNEVMEGYCDTPVPHDRRRIRPEAEGNANRNKGTLNNVMTSQENGTASERKAGRGSRPEAQGNAERNKGTLGGVLNSYSKLEIAEKPAPRLTSSAAKENQQRCQGTNIFNIGSD